MSKKSIFGPKIMKKSIFYPKTVMDCRVPKFVSSKDGKLTLFVATFHFFGRLRFSLNRELHQFCRTFLVCGWLRILPNADYINEQAYNSVHSVDEQ